MFDISQSVSDYMSVVLTHECNRSCAFCIDSYRGRNEYISMENVDKAIQVGLENNIKDILLIGGEPTLHPDVVEIARKFKKSGFRVIMTTNYDYPSVVKELDGIVDCFNISYYNQKELPRQEDFVSDITIHALIYKRRLDSKEKIDEFIDKYESYGHLKFSTLSPGNEFSERNQVGDFLDLMQLKEVVLFNEILGNLYRGGGRNQKIRQSVEHCCKTKRQVPRRW